MAYVRAAPSRHGQEKARALAELAMAVHLEQPARAGALGVEAAELNAPELRLRALVLALFEQGEVTTPSVILTRMREGGTERPADQARRAAILAQARQLSAPLVFPEPAAASVHKVARLAVVSPRSLPEHADASTWRTRAIVEAARDSGASPILFTAPGFHYPEEGGGRPFIESAGLSEISRLPTGAAPPNALEAFVAETGAALAGLFQQRHISHVHALAGTPLASAALFWGARRAGAKFVLDVGEFPTFGEGAGPAWEATERFRAGFSLFADTLRSADGVVVRSAALARALAARGCSELTVVEDTLPGEFVRAPQAAAQEIRRELGLADRRLVGVIDLLDDDEGLADLIRALPAIRAARPDVALVFCGAGRGVLTLERLAARLGVADHAITPPGFALGRMIEFLSAFSVAAFPKRRPYGPGLSAPFELQAALAVRTPVVAADNVWARDWISDGETGLLALPGDVDALAAAVLRCLDDSALGERLRGAGHASVQTRGRRTEADHGLLAALQGRTGLAAA